MPLLELRNLTVAYRGGEYALSQVSLAVAEGERLAILGESGSGKSSLALAIGILLPPTAALSGEIIWPGFDRPPRLGRDIGFVFQDPAGSLDPLMRVGDQIGEVLRANLGMPREAIPARVVALLDRVRLPDPAAISRAYPHQLSGGQKQRVAIACAIAPDPRLLIADEATSALDTIVQAGILRLLDSLVAESKMSLLLVTHDIAIAAQHADRIAVLQRGALVEFGSAAQLIQAPGSDYTKRLVRAHIAIDAPQRLTIQATP